MPTSKIRLATLGDFTGGLNLRADPFQLAPNESPDMMNVDVDPRGGFRLRGGVQPFASVLGADIDSMWMYTSTTGKQIMAQVGEAIYRSTGGAFSSVGGSGGLGAGGKMRAATFADYNYVVRNASQLTYRYSVGGGLVALTEGFRDNLASPIGGHAPKGTCICAHTGYLWIANTVESTIWHPNRVRWSHPNKPEDWRSFDFIDIDEGVDGDHITALVPFGDRLLVFKQHSIHAIYGSDDTNFSVFPVTQELGAPSQDAVVATDVGVYFFSWPEGVFLYDGRRQLWQFEKLYPAVTGRQIPHAQSSKIMLGWGNRRLWVAVPWGTSSSRSRCFVLDPTLGKTGSWVQYDLPLGPFLEWDPPGGDTLFLGAGVGKHAVVQLDKTGVPLDDFGAGDVGISSYYRTRWFDLGAPAVIKRWKRPELVMQGGTDAEVYVQVYGDYDATSAIRDFSVSTEDDSGAGLQWNSGDDWNGSGSTWQRSAIGRNEVHKGVPLGTSRAIALRFQGPPSQQWGVDALTLKYVPKQIRN